MEDLISFNTSPICQGTGVVHYKANPTIATVSNNCMSQVTTSFLVDGKTMPTTKSSGMDGLVGLDDGATDMGNRRLSFADLLQRPRQPIFLPPPPIVQQWTDEKQIIAQASKSDILGPRGKAYLFLSYDKDLEKDLIDAVHLEMKVFASGRQGVFFEVQGHLERPFLYIEAPSQDLVMGCLEEARSCADNIIHDKSTKFDLTFLEPPSASEVPAQVQLVASRPRLVVHSKAVMNDTSFDRFLAQQLGAALKKAGRIKDVINLRIHFGHYTFSTIPQGLREHPSIGLDAFLKIAQHGRTKAVFNTQIGNLEIAVQILKIIKNNSNMFLSQDMAEVTASVRPEYYFDGTSKKWRIEARLRHKDEVPREQYGYTNDGEVQTIRAIELTNGIKDRHLDFKVLSLRENFDWKIETVTDKNIKDHGYDSLKTEIRSARVQFPAIADEQDTAFPRIRFNNNATKARSFTKATIRSVFRFRYGPAPYQVELTIHRTWPSVVDMRNKPDNPLTTFGITIFGEHWGESRASEIAKTGQGWGNELENLFCVCPNNPGEKSDDSDSHKIHVNGESRVQGLINIIHDIRRTLTV